MAAASYPIASSKVLLGACFFGLETGEHDMSPLSLHFFLLLSFISFTFLYYCLQNIVAT